MKGSRPTPYVNISVFVATFLIKPWNCIEECRLLYNKSVQLVLWSGRISLAVCFRIIFFKCWKKAESNNLALLISLKLSEIAGKLTPGNSSSSSTVAFLAKSISLPYLLSLCSCSCKLFQVQSEYLINLLTDRFLLTVCSFVIFC